MKIKGKSLAASIVVIFIIFNIISLMIFTFYMQKNGEESSMEYARESSLEVTQEKSELVAIVFDRITSNTEMLGLYMEELLDREYSDVLAVDYYIEDDGTIARLKSELKTEYEQSNIIVPNTTPLTGDLIKTINMTEELDILFAQISKNEDTSWCYIVTKDNLLRVAPYRDLNQFFSSDHSQISDVFYTAAEDENNPLRKTVWTAPYYDYLGTGWTMTCSRPVYDQDGELFGVVCIDLPIEEIQQKYFEGFSLGESGKLYWITDEGNIYYHTDYEGITANQGEIFEKNIFEEKMSEEREAALRQVAASDSSGIHYFNDGGEDIMLMYSAVRGTDSILLMEIGLNEFNAFHKVGFEEIAIVVLFDIILAMIFTVIVYNSFSKPMNRLVKKAQKITAGDYSSIDFDEADKEGYYEVARLNEAFQIMNESIEEYTEGLLDKNKEINTILEAIDEALMIVEPDGEVNLQSKESICIPEESYQRAIGKVRKDKTFLSEKVVVGPEIYKNDYYPIIKDDEISKIVVSSECITKTVLLEKELQQIEKMAGVGQLAAAIVHELKNILALIKGAAYILDLADDENKDEIKTIQKAVDEAENVITTLLDFSGRDKNGSEMIHIGTIVNQILLLSKKELIGKGITVEKNIDNNSYVYTDGREAIKVILQNIIINAIQAVDADGKIEIICVQEKDMVKVVIRDNGPGIQVEPKERIFEPFLTSKNDGTGIGLWITKRLMDTLGGHIELGETNNGETEFILYMPANREEN